MRRISFKKTAYDSYILWQETDQKVFDKINDLLKDIYREPFKGIGKPEPLKGDLKGCWSRRITGEHRLVYEITKDEIIVRSCKYHYE